MDPLAEAYISWTPYQYVRNNPIRRIDPNGMSDRDANWRKENEQEDEGLKARDLALSGIQYNSPPGTSGGGGSRRRGAAANDDLQSTESKEIEAQGGGAENGLPTIGGQKGPWSYEYIIEKGFEFLTHPAVGTIADFADHFRFTKGLGNSFTALSVASDSYQRFFKKSIDNMIFSFRLTTTGVALWTGYTSGPIGGFTIGLYSKGIEDAARTGAETEIKMRYYFNLTTKGNFWKKFYW